MYISRGLKPSWFMLILGPVMLYGVKDPQGHNSGGSFLTKVGLNLLENITLKLVSLH